MSETERHPDYARAVALYYEGSIEWVEFTSYGNDDGDSWDYFLGVVPPVDLSDGTFSRRGAFMCGEPYTHTASGEEVYLAMKRDASGVCFGRLMTQAEFEREFPPRPKQPKTLYLAAVNSIGENVGESHRLVRHEDGWPVLACGVNALSLNWTGHPQPPTALCARCAEWERSNGDAQET